MLKFGKFLWKASRGFFIAFVGKRSGKIGEIWGGLGDLLGVEGLERRYFTLEKRYFTLKDNINQVFCIKTR